MKRIVTVQDISCLGKCSLTVALPIISAMGVETCVIPTAVLSTHTAFDGFTFRDLTDDIPEIVSHWVKEKFQFDAVYTGYLGSEKQIDIVAGLFERLKNENTLIIVDPAMGDMGKLYKGFTPEFAKKMGSLVAKADIAVPNITEAAYMLDKPYIESGYGRDYIEDMLLALAELGAKKAVLTGVSFQKGKIGVMGYDSEKKEFFEYYNDEVDSRYHGTGDVFASCLTGGLMNGLPIEKALQLSADFTAECIALTKKNVGDNAYGVDFELCMPGLIKGLEELK
ncbi:MAG: pyridoxamine kinase [Firmicutes bacterium]|nr:pyridoxamine kinase [Bacillota bacterium]